MFMPTLVLWLYIGLDIIVHMSAHPRNKQACILICGKVSVLWDLVTKVLLAGHTCIRMPECMATAIASQAQPIAALFDHYMMHWYHNVVSVLFYRIVLPYMAV